jgi:galactokinase
MVGGGFGGSAIALAKVGDISAIQSAILAKMNEAGFPASLLYISAIGWRQSYQFTLSLNLS